MKALAEIKQNSTSITLVLQKADNGWTLLAVQPSKCHSSDSDSNDDMPLKGKENDSCSNLNAFGDMFESQSFDASGNVIYLMS